MAEADLAVVDELDAGLLARDARDLLADVALQHAVDMGVVVIDEARRAAGGGDLGRDGLLGVGPAGGDLDGAEPVLLDVLRVAAELARREVLGLDAAAALLVEHLGPGLEGIVSGEPIASEWPMRQTNFCCARATIGAPTKPAAARPAAPLSTSRRPKPPRIVEFVI